DGDSNAHFDGHSWSSASSQDYDFKDVWSPGGGTAWVIGKLSTFTGGEIFRSDGHTMNRVKSIDPQNPSGVWGSGAGDVWAVGDRGLLLHWDGLDWKTASPGTSRDLKKVWGSSANDVWIGGNDGVILHKGP